MNTTPRYTFDVASDLYRAGFSCDGHPFVAECFYVVATDARGNRWAHHATFRGCLVERDEEGQAHFADARPAAQHAAEQLLRRIQAAGGRINLDHWREARPEYGSAAYVAYGQADDVAWEREQG